MLFGLPLKSQPYSPRVGQQPTGNFWSLVKNVCFTAGGKWLLEVAQQKLLHKNLALVDCRGYP